MSDSTELVHQGKDGWLFMQNDSNDVLGQLEGKISLSSSDIKKWELLFSARKAFFEKKGIKYYFFVAPNKESVMSEKLKLDQDILVKESGTLTEVKEVYEKVFGESLINPFSELYARRDECYSKGDSHWNHFGAYIGYKKLMETISREFKQANIVKAEDIKFLVKAVKGDLQLKLNDQTENIQVASVNGFGLEMIEDNRCPNRGKALHFRTKIKDAPRVILFRDSFSSALMPFIANSFRELFVFWQPNIDYSLVELINPDLVISQQAERFLIKVPDEINGLTNSEIAESKGYQGLKKFKD